MTFVMDCFFLMVQVLSEASLVPLDELQSETACDKFGTSRRLAPVENKFGTMQRLAPV